jgi:alpha-pyrone synthase
VQRAYIHRIATAVPRHDIHDAFVAFGSAMLQDERARSLFLRMAAKSGIAHRFSPLQVSGPFSADSVNAHDLYRIGSFPGTAERMQIFERFAPQLLREALDKLRLSAAECKRIRHVIVTGCTGLYAPGLDFVAIDHLQLSPETERTMIGFMGCYAAINGLKQARHIVRSEPAESVLLINLELCSLHLHETQKLSEVLSFLVFGDGCAVTLISSEPSGLAIDGFRAIQIEETRDLITWRLGDLGFDMLLSGQVPGEIEKALRAESPALLAGAPVELWAVHPGGRSVLDAVEAGLSLLPTALASSRKVLAEFGNMSSATVMFVLAELMQHAKAGQRGCAMSFGPGLTAETMGFHVA